MKREIILTVSMTVVISLLFIYFNPILLTDISGDYESGEVFYPEGNQYDFKLFNISVSNSTNFTAEIVSSGHVKLLSGKGYAINVVQYDRMYSHDAESAREMLDNEMHNPSQEIDGVTVYTADFKLYKRYGSFVDNGNVELYVTSDNPKETAYMVNSLIFEKDLNS